MHSQAGNMGPLLGLALTACGPAGLAADSSGSAPAPDDSRPWRRGLPPLAEEVEAPRGWLPVRSVIHLHSPWSHDACDGQGIQSGVPAADCLEDLRSALCTAGVDFAFITDHPDHAATVPWDDMLLRQAGDTIIDGPWGPMGHEIGCPTGHTVTWLPGIEDDLMPVALQRHAGTGELSEAHALYNRSDAQAIAASREAGALVFVNHPEGRTREEMSEFQDAGGTGIEVFNLHAAFDPRIRSADLGLEPASWLSDIQPFTSPEGTAEPDLFVLGVLEPQVPSLAHWDQLSTRSATVGVTGTDAHQNVMPVPLRDGERGDGYRRMLRWLNTTLLVEDRTVESARTALASGRAYVAFEALGTPAGVDLHHRAEDGEIVEMGGTATAGGHLEVGCVSLSADSPRGLEAPEVTIAVLRDGTPWAEGCGAHAVTTPGVYRVEISLTPHHLTPFLGDSPEVWMKTYPWVYTNPIRITAAP